MALRKIGKYYYCYFRDEFGKLHTLSTRQTEKDKAKEFERDTTASINAKRMKLKLLKFATPELLEKVKETESLAGKPEETKTAHKRGTMALSVMFETACQHRNLSSSHKAAWDHFCDNIGVKYADQVTPKMALDYLNKYFSEKKTKTWNNHKSQLNSIFRLTLVDAGLTVSPFASIMNKLVTDTESHRNLSEKEIQTILSSGDDISCLMTMLARWTGQRLETCAKMTFAEFDFEKKVYLKKPGKTARFNKWVCVPLFPPLEKYLISHKDKFPSPDIPMAEQLPNWISGHRFSGHFVKLLKKLDICSNEHGTATFHSLRGSFITWAIDAGLSADIRRAITGHSSLSMEDVYARAIESVSQAAKSICM